MKKIVFLIFCLFLIFSCSNEFEEKAKYNGEVGCIIIKKGVDSNERKLDVSLIKSVSYKIESSDIENPITGTSEINNDGTGNIEIPNVPCGKNRIITIIAKNNSSENIKGFEIATVCNINAGINEIALIDWKTTVKANVYKKLLSSGKKIAEFTSEQNNWISSVVPNTVSYLVNTDLIASDFENLHSSMSYILDYGRISFAAVSANGYTVCVNDPSSEIKKVTDDGAYGISNVAPGTWTYVIKDNNGIEKKRDTVTVLSEKSVEIDPIGDIFKDKLYIFIKSASIPTIWAWVKDGTSISEQLGENWPGAVMQAATSAYMKQPTGWYMKDCNALLSITGNEIHFKLNGSDPEYNSGKTSTFWYDGTDFYDSDPTATLKSSDVTLSDIKINGISIGANTTSYILAVNTSNSVVEAIPTDSNASVSISPSGSISIAEGASQNVTITVTAEDESTKTYTLTISRAMANDTSISKIQIGSTVATLSGTIYTANVKGTTDQLNASVSVTPTDLSATVASNPSSVKLSDGENATVTITVTNGSKTATYTLNVSYTKQAKIESQYYWTNKDSHYGTNKTISSWSDWTAAEQIAQCAAYDDPRTWRGVQEVSYDVYALYAAYDDANLYLMAELVNLPDKRASFMNHDYAGSDNAWWDNRDCPIGFIINTGKGKTSTAPLIESATGAPIWDKVNFTDATGFDFLFYASSKYGYADHKSSFVGVGTPGLFKLNQSTGYFSYDEAYCLSVNKNNGATTAEAGTEGTSGMTIRYKRQCAVTTTIYFESTPTDNRTTSGQDGASLMESTTYTSATSNDLDMSYWYTIPLATLGIDKSYIQSYGIGVRQLTPNGGSLMDCCPWDVSMVNDASDPCSDDESSSHEKEDKDDITSAQARVGR